MNFTPETQHALTELFKECATPFVLDEDNKDHLVVKDCRGVEVMSSHLTPVGVNVYAQESHLRARLVARVIVSLSQDNRILN